MFFLEKGIYSNSLTFNADAQQVYEWVLLSAPGTSHSQSNIYVYVLDSLCFNRIAMDAPVISVVASCCDDRTEGSRQPNPQGRGAGHKLTNSSARCRMFLYRCFSLEPFPQKPSPA
jgi:hypothetical protein